MSNTDGQLVEPCCARSPSGTASPVPPNPLETPHFWVHSLRLHWAMGVLVLPSQTCTLFLETPMSGPALQRAGARQSSVRPGPDDTSCGTTARPALPLHRLPIPVQTLLLLCHTKFEHETL